MSFWESLAMTGTMATVLGVALTVYGILNNKILRAEMAAVRDILDRIERGQEALRQEVAEVRREMAEARREMAEALKYLASLVVSESERTRQAIRGTP